MSERSTYENGGTIFPFHCGSQYADWMDKNCGNCRKSRPADEHGNYIGHAYDGQFCDLEDSVSATYAGRGLTDGEAKRMGHPKEHYYCWPCAEIEPATPEIAEAVARWHEKYSEPR
jgi:hypothetical protein